MTKVRVESFTISLDGYGAGPDQALSRPMGTGGEKLHGWAFETQTFRRMFGQPGGSTDVDESFASRGMENLGAWIMGRNMFGPVRGNWPANDDWKGWWGENPPYHVPVFVLTHHPRPSLYMAGGTVFHFITDGIQSALDKALAVANGKDIRIGGGVATVQAYLKAGLIDRMHIAVSPVLLGRGEALFHGLDLPSLGYALKDRVSGEGATHLTIEKSNS